MRVGKLIDEASAAKMVAKMLNVDRTTLMDVGTIEKVQIGGAFMSEASKVEEPGAAGPPAPDVAAIGKVVREELDRQNKYLEFAQGQIEKDRSFYKHLYTYAGAFLAFMVAIAGIFSYTSVSQMRTDMKASVDAELVALRAQAGATSSEAQATVNSELSNVRTEVQKRIDTEFRSDNIAALVATAAKERTANEISGIIRSETATQVAKGIQDQSPAIQKSVEDQTRAAVTALQPMITSIIKSELEAQVTKSVAPVEAQMKAYQNLNALSASARNDDRKAFDQLAAIGTEPGEEAVRTLARATVLEIVRQKNNVLRRMSVKFREKQAPEFMKQILRGSKNKDERLAAMDNFPESDMSIVPLLVETIRSDDDLEVVATAFRVFDVRTKQSFQFPDYPGVFNWWTSNHAAFEQNQPPK